MPEILSKRGQQADWVAKPRGKKKKKLLPNWPGHPPKPMLAILVYGVFDVNRFSLS